MDKIFCLSETRNLLHDSEDLLPSNASMSRWPMIQCMRALIYLETTHSSITVDTNKHVHKIMMHREKH